MKISPAGPLILTCPQQILSRRYLPFPVSHRAHLSQFSTRQYLRRVRISYQPDGIVVVQISCSAVWLFTDSGLTMFMDVLSFTRVEHNGGNMKIRRDIMIAGLLGLFLAVTAHSGSGQASIFNSGPSLQAHSAVHAGSAHRGSGHTRSAHASRHHRHRHHTAG